MASLIQELGQSVVVQRARRFGEAKVAAIEETLGKDRNWRLAIAALFILQIALALTHEPWFDEWQSYLIAAESSSMAQLLQNLRYEGHPPTWYLLLQGFGLVFDRDWVLPATVLAVGLPAQALILAKAPFTRAERLLLCCGCFLLFEFFTISRGASLGVALCIAAAASWRSRWFWLPLALLPLCDMLFGVISGILIILRWQEKRWSWLGAMLWLGCGLLAAWTVRPAPDVVPALEPQNVFRQAFHFLESLGVLLLPFQTNGLVPKWDGVPPFGLGPLLGAGFLYFAWRATRTAPLHRLLFFGMVAYCFVFTVAIYGLPVRHLMLLAVVLILLAWLRGYQGEPLGQGMRLWLFVGAVCGLLVAAINFAFPFDTSDRVVREIERRGLNDKVWMAFPDAEGLGIGIYAKTGKRFLRPEQHCLQGYVIWNNRSKLKTLRRFRDYLRALSNEIGGFYLLTSSAHPKIRGDLLKPVALVRRGYDGRNYFLFRVAPALPEANRQFPLCAIRQQVNKIPRAS